MKIEVLTLFPELFERFLSTSLIGKAINSDLLSIRITNIRDFANPPHYHVDDTPYGGGAGMVMRPEPLGLAIEAAKSRLSNAQIILLTPSGEQLTQAIAEESSRQESLILLCARYEGIDQRIIEIYVDREISIGDYVLMGGELPAMVLIEASARLIDGVVGNSDSVRNESFSDPSNRALLEAPHYTRPPEYQDRRVPEVLLSGDHEKIAKWRAECGAKKTNSRSADSE